MAVSLEGQTGTREIKHVGFFIGQEEAAALLKLRSTYHISTTNLFRLYLIWLMETDNVPIGLPNSIYEITRDPRQS